MICSSLKFDCLVQFVVACVGFCLDSRTTKQFAVVIDYFGSIVVFFEENEEIFNTSVPKNDFNDQSIVACICSALKFVYLVQFVVVCVGFCLKIRTTKQLAVDKDIFNSIIVFFDENEEIYNISVPKNDFNGQSIVE